MSNLPEVTAPVLEQCLRACILARRPAFTWGSPGIGKSDAHRRLADFMGAHMIDIRASQFDAVDTRGIPYLYEGKTKWAVPEIFPSEAEAAKYKIIIVFLDELNAAMLSVQAALYQLVLDRGLGDYVLPDNVFILAAGNLESDRAVTNRMSSALADRFFHFKLVVDPSAWEQWALGIEEEGRETEALAPMPAPIQSVPLHIAPVSFMRWKPDMLHQFDPKANQKCSPTPRGWQYVSDALKVVEEQGLPHEVEAALILGKLGEAVGTEFLGFLKIYRGLQDPAGVIMDPDGADISDDPSVNWALCGALAQRATEDNIDRIIRYAERLGQADEAGPEFEVLLVRTAKARHPEIQQTAAFIRWATSNESVL